MRLRGLWPVDSLPPSVRHSFSFLRFLRFLAAIFPGMLPLARPNAPAVSRPELVRATLYRSQPSRNFEPHPCRARPRAEARR